jgi:hypothetical protein
MSCILWLLWQQTLLGYGVFVSMSTLLSDSTSAIIIARDSVRNDLTKYISVDAYYIRSQIQDGVIAFK